MRSVQTKIIIVISAIILVVVVSFLLISTSSTNAILTDDSDRIMLSAADYYANIIDDNFRSTEQSVGTIYNYSIKRAETYNRFLEDEAQRDGYTYDVSELGKSIAENTRGAMAVYLRYNPEDYGSTNGFWYTINLSDSSWQPSVPTDMSLYDKDDVEHVGWYYIPVRAGVPMWMDPYFNANLGVNMISYIIPYYYGDYTVGIIGMDISLDLLKESAAEVKVYKTGCAFMMETNGNIIYHRDFPEGMSFDGLSDGEGSTFSFRLVQKIDDPTPIGSYEERVKANSRHSPDELPRITGVNVLVVDDFAMNLKVAGHLLKLFGIKPDLAASGQEAVEAVSGKTYDIVFLDHMMPVMDGIETLGVLNEKRMIDHASTKVVALTANAVVGAKDLYLSAGFDDYLSKPIEVKALENILLKYLPGDHIGSGSETRPETAPEAEDPPAVTSGTLDGGSVVLEFAPHRKSVKKPSYKDGAPEKALRERAGLDVRGGMSCCGGELPLYIEILTDYAELYSGRAAELEEYSSNRDAENYRILIHALKSSSGTIGASELSELARALEDAAKRGDTDYISAHHGQFAEMYGNTVKAIKAVLKEYNM